MGKERRRGRWTNSTSSRDQIKILQFAKNSEFPSWLAVEHKDKGCLCVSRSEPGPKAQQHGWNSHLLSHFLFKM